MSLTTKVNTLNMFIRTSEGDFTPVMLRQAELACIGEARDIALKNGESHREAIENYWRANYHELSSAEGFVIEGREGKVFSVQYVKPFFKPNAVAEGVRMDERNPERYAQIKGEMAKKFKELGI